MKFDERKDMLAGQAIDYTYIAKGIILTEKLKTEIMDGKVDWFVAGRVTYIDRLDEPHYTRFCYSFAPEANSFKIYPKYNDAD
jgi:hypothetical protein